MKRVRKWSVAVLILAALLVQGCANTGMIRLPFVKYPIERTYKAPFDATWKAATAAMKDYELVVQDAAAGHLISDWIRGNSDTYHYRDQNGEEKPCRCEFSIHAKAEEVDKGKTLVRIQLYERTLMVYPGAGSVWEKTESSTLREKAILDKIGDILSRKQDAK